MRARLPLCLLLGLFVCVGCEDDTGSHQRLQANVADPDDADGGGGQVSPTLVLAPSSGTPGITIEASGDEFVESCSAELFWESLSGPSLGVAVIEEGSFSIDIMIPAAALLGEHTVVAQGREGEEVCEEPSGEEARATFTISVSQPPTGPFDFKIYLKQRIVEPDARIDRDLLGEIQDSQRPFTHAVVQLHSLPRQFRRELVDGVLQDVPADDVATLESLGVHLLEYLNGIDEAGTAYVASISREVNATDPMFNELVRAIVRLEPSDKVASGLLVGTEPIDVLVVLFNDVPEDEALGLFEARGLAVERRADNLFETRASPATIESLSADDAVEWIEAGPLAFLPTVDDVRAALNVEAVQQFDMGSFDGLSGVGVQVGIMDSGVDPSHNDFTGRLIRMQSPLGDHGTNAAGVVAGSGAQSDQVDGAGNPNGGSPFQWRGVAPRAALAAYPHAGGDARLYRDAVNGLGVDVTNHSYVLEVQGLYSADVVSVDRIVRGDSSGIPARPVVWAAGNNADLRSGPCPGDGDRPQYPPGCGPAFQAGYFSVLAPAKNSICVAAVDKETLTHSSFSSLGPTMDGRLKPDLAALGSGVVAPSGSAAGGGPGNGYRVVEGSSMAAPAVTGVVALMLEQYAETFGVNLNADPPLPSTIKAILIHTAMDLEGADSTTNADTGEPVAYGAGPDWATGYGLVNAEAAVQLIANEQFVAGELDSSNASDEFVVAVIPGQTSVRLTIAWDDIAASPLGGATAPKLVNDLNLVLVDPGGTEHLPSVLPLVTPKDCDGDPSNGVQVGTCAGLDPADQAYDGPLMRVVDRRNNVEQVVVENAEGLTAGNWRARVSLLHRDGVSLRLPLGGSQPYSLAGVTNQRADLSVAKIDDPDPVVAGESLFYTVEVMNEGPHIAPDVTVRDLLPAGVTYVTDTGGCVEGPDGTLTCRLGDLGVGEAREFTVRVAVDPNLVAEAGGPTTIANEVEVFSGIPDDDMTDNARTAVTIVEEEADLRVAKDCKPDRNLPAGQTGTCTIIVDNLGPSTARSVVLTDMFLSDDNFTVTSITSSHGSCGDLVNGVFTCNLGDLLPASPSEPGRATITVELTASEAVDISDIATVESATPDPDMSNNEAEDDVAIDAVADLELSMTASADTVVAGTALSYDLTVINNGPSTAVNVRVETALPAGLILERIETSAGGTCIPGVPGDPVQPSVCVIGSLAPSESRTIALETSVLPQTTGTLHAHARVWSEVVVDFNNANDLASASTSVDVRADLAVSLEDFPDPVIAGEELVYEVAITNGGPSTARDTTLQHEIPEQFTFIAAQISGGGGTCVFLPRTTVSCELGDIDPGETVTVFVTVAVEVSTPDGSVLTSTASVSSSAEDPDPANNATSQTTTVITQADLAITKIDVPDPVVAGRELTYEITIANQGPSVAQDVRLRDTLPEGVEFVSETVSRGDGTCVVLSGSPPTLICDLGDVDQDEIFTVFLTLRVAPSVADGTVLTNTATVATSTVDPDETNNTATVMTAVSAEADLEIELSAFRDTGNPSATFIYTVTVTNHGPSDAQDVVVVDTLPLSPNTQKVIYVFDSGGCVRDDSNVLTCEFGTLPAGEPLSFDIHVQFRGSLGVVTNRAEVSSSTSDPDPSDNVATRDSLVEGGALRPGNGRRR